ncbi:hypothetical protein ACFXQA_01750 [Microbacterium sp. P07]|uniref:hypothetical protein n=1 Tax=Microbacterium sp. P07 TaxID=3366952 RepID=UPI00374590E8
MEAEIARAELPIVRDLRSAGYDIATPPQLDRNETTSWPTALAILAHHLERGSYPDLVRYRIVRLFGRPEGLPYWDLVMSRYVQPNGRSEQAGAAYALAAMATNRELKDLMTLVRVDNGAAREEFVEPIVRLSGGAGSAEVRSLSEQPELDQAVITALRGLNATTDREQLRTRALGELAVAVRSRAQPVMTSPVVEWSTSLDIADWKRFARFLSRELGGELTGPLGKALFTVIETAPQDDEDHVLIKTDLGVVRVGWFVDDVDTVDTYIFGSQQVHDLCDSWYRANEKG